MVRIAKLTDYGVMIMAVMAANPFRIFQAREIADETALATPTVSKLLKKLTKSELLSSHRGTHGGYQLNCSPEKITVADLVDALEGPIAITECNLEHNQCKTASSCHVKAPWSRINQIITQALRSVTLSDLINRPISLTVERIS